MAWRLLCTKPFCEGDVFSFSTRTGDLREEKGKLHAFRVQTARSLDKAGCNKMYLGQMMCCSGLEIGSLTPTTRASNTSEWSFSPLRLRQTKWSGSNLSRELQTLQRTSTSFSGIYSSQLHAASLTVAVCRHATQRPDEESQCHQASASPGSHVSSTARRLSRLPETTAEVHLC